ncbi:hypothetical protein N658DRAFT_492896 [Parathielavia hyrcaniae]|uniref:Uncharacterized protein n=1 Tax=Parathielavia hyrcaniae TaxID=113614 RepID=A0AAN6T5H1_9PEZI|nr:hypothetical protein N658DRAFT_492896 [Parathielavia hyrcaniae]
MPCRRLPHLSETQDDPSIAATLAAVAQLVGATAPLSRRVNHSSGDSTRPHGTGREGAVPPGKRTGLVPSCS